MRTQLRPRRPLQIAAIAVGAVLLTVGGCGALVAGALWLGENELDDHEITRATYDSLQIGTARAAVEAELPEPLEREEDGDLECLTYHEAGEGLLEADFFDLCFDEDGRLATKDAY